MSYYGPAGGGGDYSGYGYGGQQAKPKTWTTAPFMSEFCDSIADTLTIKPQATQCHQTYNQIIRHLLRKCGTHGEIKKAPKAAAAAAAADATAEAAASGGAVIPPLSLNRRRREQRARDANAKKKDDDEEDDEDERAIGEDGTTAAPATADGKKKGPVIEQFPEDLQAPAARALHRLRAAVRRAEPLFKKFDEFQTWRLQFYVSKIADDAANLIATMRQPGELCFLPLLVPENIVMLIENIDEETAKVVLINPNSFNKYHTQSVDDESPSKIKADITMSVGAVEKRKLTSEAWWSIALLSSMANLESECYYTHFVSWLTGKTHEEQVAAGKALDEQKKTLTFATPAKSSNTLFWKAMIHTLKYVLRSEGLSTDQVKLVRHYVKRRLLSYAVKDLEDQDSVKFSTKQLIEHAAKNTASSVSRNAHMMGGDELTSARAMVDKLHSRLARLECDDDGTTPAPPQLDITNGWHLTQQADSFPLFECLRRTEGVDKFAGQALENPRTAPTNFLRIPEKVTTFQEALEAIDECVTVVVRLTTSPFDIIRNIPLLVTSLIGHLFIEVLPHPLGPATRESGRTCIWADTPMLYGQQLHILKRLGECIAHFAHGNASWADEPTNTGLRMTVHASACAIADAIIRKKGTDRTMLWTTHYEGLGGRGRFAFDLGPYAEHTETLTFLYPEALVARAHILDYFSEITAVTSNANIIWKWENGVNVVDKAGTHLLRQIALSEALPTNGVPSTLLGNVDGKVSLFLRQNPEVMFLRNIVFYFKFTLRHETPPQENFLSAHNDSNGWPCQVRFEPAPPGYNVYAFGGNQLSMDARPPPQVHYNAVASRYTAPMKADTENDILHIQNLQAFEETMGQRDVEVLLSYLTVPYMRIPLVLRFLATEDRVSTLRATSVQKMLQAVLFDAGKFLTRSNSNKCPEDVPTSKPELVAAPHGLLLNELFNSTSGVVDPLLRLAELVAELDPGTVFNSSANVTLFLVRIIARIQSFISLALDIVEEVEVAESQAAKDRAMRRATIACPTLTTKTFGEMRDVAIQNKSELLSAKKRVQDYVASKTMPMLQAWIDEANAKMSSAQGKSSIDEVTAIAVNLHAHIVLLLRPVKEEEMDETFVKRLLSSFMFISARYTWGRLTIPEHELYAIIHMQRRKLIKFMSKSPVPLLSRALDAVVESVTGGSTTDGDRHRWGFVAGPDTVGRFARLDDEVVRKQRELKPQDREKAQQHLSTSLTKYLGVSPDSVAGQPVLEGTQEVELNTQTLSLTFKSTHLQALPSEVLGEDVETVFSQQVDNLEALQCAFIEMTTHRLWMRLVGQQHDVMYWKTDDPRFPVPDDKQMRFFPDDLADSEVWIKVLFEPVRQAYYERNFWDPPIFILLPERKLTSENSVAKLSAVDSQSGELLKEIYVFRDFGTVHAYDVHSFGRRFYHTLVFASDSRFCLRQLDPDTKNRQNPWPRWGRHAAGDGMASVGSDTSSVIVRHPTHPENMSGSAETFIPSRLILGLIPEFLLDTHQFWQDADDNLRGYPKFNKAAGEERPPHMLWVHWKETQFDAINGKNTGARVFRFPRGKAVPMCSEEAIGRSSFVNTTAEMLDADDATEEQAVKMRFSDEDTCISVDQQAGLFQEAPEPTKRGAKATVEDNDLLLVDLMYARRGTPLHSIACVLARLDCLSHILVWTKSVDYDGTGPLSLDLVQLPRLKLSFTARLSPDKTEYLLYSLDHSQLFVSNDHPALVTQQIQGIPHSVVLRDSNSAFSILVPALEVIRPRILSAPFSTDVVINRGNKRWYEQLDTRYYLYPVHVSLSFVFTPTLASALYLLMLRFYHRSYAEVFHLAGTIGTDMEFTAEERQIFERLSVLDVHPDAHACRCKIALLVADAPVDLQWHPPSEMGSLLVKLAEVSVSCRMTQSEERRLLRVCSNLEARMKAINEYIMSRDAVAIARDAENDGVPVEVEQLVRGGSLSTMPPDARRAIQHFSDGLLSHLREKLDIRVVRDELKRLLALWLRYGRHGISEYFSCLIHNRQLIVDAEIAATEEGKGRSREKLKLHLPEVGRDLQWLSYKSYDALSTKPAGSFGTLTNSEHQAVAMSPRIDYYYCGQNCRKHNQCHCRSCNDSCGPQNGCPCNACEKFNDEDGANLRQLIPVLDSSKSARQLSFFEAFGWINEVVRSYARHRPKRKVFLEKEPPMSLRVAMNSFLRYYECVTGTTKIKIAHQDSARDMAEILFHFSRECRSARSGIGHMAHFVVQTPAAWPKLAKHNRATRQSAETWTSAIYNSIWMVAAQFRDGSKGAADDAAARAMKALMQQEAAKEKEKEKEKTEGEEGDDADKDDEESRQKEESELAAKRAALAAEEAEFAAREERRIKGPKFIDLDVDVKLRPESRRAEEPLHKTTALPTPRNTDCASRSLALPNAAALVLLGNELQTINSIAEVLDELQAEPLRRVLADREYVVYRTRAEQGLGTVPSDLPFDLTKHESASKAVAKSMLSRLGSDMAHFASQANTAPLPKLKGMDTDDLVAALFNGTESAEYKSLLKQIDEILDRVSKLRASDADFVAHAVPVITRTANHIDATGEDALSKLLFLRRYAGREATLGLEYLLASLCSTTASEEWANLNPFLTKDRAEALQNLITVTVLRANRIGQCNRATEIAADLKALLLKATQVPENLQGAQRQSHVDALIASSAQKADSLATELTTTRVFFDDKSFDPRFLLFEFTWNLVIRGHQRELISEMYDSITKDQSIVKQMIMGAGKTTVVGPLLGLMLANGQQLVIQVVPPALLDFTRSVLRTTFSSVLQKQIFTFSCDRASEVDNEALAKFQHARQSRGIVVTTPSAVKSVFLKYVEGLEKLTDGTRPRDVEAEKETEDLLGVLNLWREAVLIMDEVDMLLHPLKSELNFPIGQKAEIDMAPLRWKLPMHLIDAAFYYHSKRITTSMKENPIAFDILAKFRDAVQEGLGCNALQEMPHLTLLNLEFYEESLKPILAQWLLLFLKAQHLFGLSDADTVQYLLKRPTKQFMPELLERVEKLDDDHIRVLNFAFDWLNAYMPHIMQKIDRVSFGIMNPDDMKRAREEHPHMPRSRFVTAIPFVGKDLPSQSSEFAHPDIVIGLTILGYRYEGIRPTDFGQILSDLHGTVEKEVGRYSQRRTNVMYNTWVQAAGGRVLASHLYGKKKEDSSASPDAEESGMGLQPTESISYQAGDVDGLGEHTTAQEKRIDILPLRLMRQANQQEVDKLFDIFKRTPEVIHWYLSESVFPEFMRHQQSKLSASGQELGGDMIFKRRIGFSGTPSDLLPAELGTCEYERGTDGRLIHTLTDPNVVSYAVVEPGWTVRTLLDHIALCESPVYDALIDTGALITGMSNLQVAQYLLKYGLKNKDGVVFLDEFDRKMILVRATGRVLKLAECGIPKQRRFAFYDQVHTTGMDIEHTPNAVAIQTLGKDMVFRDFAQGAYRMRGISQGQRVKLMIIPEVYDLIGRTLRSIRSAGWSLAPLKERDDHDVLVDVTAWLLANSIKSEHTQHNQLCLQNCANVWRKEAFAKLQNLEPFKAFKALEAERQKKLTEQGQGPTTVQQTEAADKKALTETEAEKTVAKLDDASLTALQVYRETISFAIDPTVPQPRMFSENVAEYVKSHEHLINTPAGRNVVDVVLEQTRREDEVDRPVIDVQMVQEQEEEREAEEEQEKEQEIEIEKFVDLTYSRDEEKAGSWRLDSLADIKQAAQFYPLSDFHLYKRRPLDFPSTILLSRNYFNAKWAGHRRIKNVIITLEWVPDRNEVKIAEAPSLDYGALTKNADSAVAERLKTTVDLVKAHQGTVTEALMADMLQTALHVDQRRMKLSGSDMDGAVKRVVAAGKEDSTALTTAFTSELEGNNILAEETGRYTVAVTLDEAQTLRRVVHIRNAQFARADGGDKSMSIVPSKNTALALHVAPSHNQLLDASPKFPNAKTPYQVWRDYQCLRFFDCDLHYSDSEFGLLLRALHGNAEKARQAFFQQTIACRRRARQRWERTPVAHLFVMRDAFTLLHQRAIGLCVKRELGTLDLNLGDAFLAFNNSHSGVLAPDEIWGAMRFCRLMQLTADDVLDFVDMADSHHEGTVLYQDFVAALTGEQEMDDGAEQESSNVATGANDEAEKGKRLPTVEPHGGEELKMRRAKRLADRRAAESEANKEAESENLRVMQEIENEQIAADLALAQEAQNPIIDEKAITFSFNTDMFPPLIAPIGPRNKRVMTDNVGTGETASMVPAIQLRGADSGSGLRCSLRLLKRFAGTDSIQNFCVSAEFKCGDLKSTMLQSMASNGRPLVAAEWLTRVYGFNGYTLSGTPSFEVDIFGQVYVQPEAAHQEGDDEAAKQQARMQKQKQQLFGNRSGGAGGDGKERNDVIHLFPEPKPTPNADGALAAIERNGFVVAAGEKLMNSIDGVTYEWMKISFPKEGWVVTARNGRGMWSQLHTMVRFGEQREQFFLEIGPAPAYMTLFNDTLQTMDVSEEPEIPRTKEERKRLQQQRRAQRRKLYGVAADDDTDEDNKSSGDEDEGNTGEQKSFGTGVGSDITDLLEALRAAKRLKPGDKVVRNPDEWDHGNEDGGRGKIGRVLRLDGEKAEVQWPSGVKKKYAWGADGRFELIKVADADDDDGGDQRETFNDDRWVPDIRGGANKCDECGAPKLEPGNWFRCNHCDRFDLCKKCFRDNKHDSHHFTDMGALQTEQAKNDLGVGTSVRIKLSVTKPKYGWEGGAKAGMTGTIIEIDDDKVITVELSNGNTWRCEAAEIEGIVTTEGDADKDKAGAGNVVAYPFLQAVLERARARDADATEDSNTPPAAVADDADPKKMQKERPATHFLDIALKAAKEASVHKFKVGDTVKYCVGATPPHFTNGRATACQVRAVLPKKRYELSSPSGWFSQVEESHLSPFPFHQGDRVRIRKDLQKTRDWCYMSLDTLRQTVATISRIDQRSGKYCRFALQFPNYGTFNFYEDELETMAPGKWALRKLSKKQLAAQAAKAKDASAAPAAPADDDEEEQDQAAPVPTSSNVIIERAFVDGTQHLQVFIRDDVYNLDLATNEVTHRGTVIGHVERDPKEPFHKGEEKKKCDDGFPHLLSLVVKGSNVTAVVDGRQATVEHVGALSAVQNDEDRKALVAAALTYTTNIPLNLMYSSATKQQAPGGPIRSVNWARFDYGIACELDDVMAWHAVTEASLQWKCKECGADNGRGVDQCEECRAPRLVRKNKDDDRGGKMRAAGETSREAAAVRTRLQGRLRAQYQRQLDAIEEAAAAEEKEQGTKEKKSDKKVNIAV